MSRWIRALLISLLALTALNAWADEVTSAEFNDWRQRFAADYSAAAKVDRTSEHKTTDQPWRAALPFANSVWSEGIADDALEEMQASHQLFPTGRAVHAMRAGDLISRVIQNSDFAGYGGSRRGDTLHQRMPAETLEIVYIKAWDDGDRVDELLRREFKARAALKLPSAGTLQRDAYPFLIFRKVDGKLYLAALTGEFMKIINAVSTMQIS